MSLALLVGSTLRRYRFPARYFSGIDVVIENKIKEWQAKGGEDTLPKGKRLQGDKHRELANSWGVGADYTHSKILADNNIKPESIERRLKLDRQWNELKIRIQQAFQQQNPQMSPGEFAKSALAKELFAQDIEGLDRQAKKVNDAIISDSMRFNGRSPVAHARRFRLEERVLEALREEE